jgi:hypothetical protein
VRSRGGTIPNVFSSGAGPAGTVDGGGDDGGEPEAISPDPSESPGLVVVDAVGRGTAVVVEPKT